MPSRASQTFDHAIEDAIDLLNHFDALNTKPPPQQIEVLKRASLVLALAALETYFEDRLVEATEALCAKCDEDSALAKFLRDSLTNDLKFFHTPSTDRVRPLFQKYLGIDITEGWVWNNVIPATARADLNKLAKKRGDIAHRSWRPKDGQAKPERHAVTRDDMRRHVHFVRELVRVTDAYLESRL